MSATCEICDKSYDDHMRTFKIKNKNVIKTVCSDCFNLEKKKIENSDKFYFYPHIPGFCEGCDVELEIFDTIKEVAKRIKKYSRYGTLATDPTDKPNHIIMTVRKDGTSWWVHGYSNAIENLYLPDYRSLAKE